MTINILTQSELKSKLHYNPDTGIFSWIRPKSNHKYAKSWAGSIESNGYIRIGFKGERYLAHRLAWFYVYGFWPTNQIDHKNLIKTDNRLENLREATCSENAKNKAILSINTSGYKGVCFNKYHGKWQAYCRHNGKRHFLGRFFTAQEASNAYNKFSSKNHGEFYREGSQPT